MSLRFWKIVPASFLCWPVYDSRQSWMTSNHERTSSSSEMKDEGWWEKHKHQTTTTKVRWSYGLSELMIFLFSLISLLPHPELVEGKSIMMELSLNRLAQFIRNNWVSLSLVRSEHTAHLFNENTRERMDERRRRIMKIIYANLFSIFELAWGLPLSSTQGFHSLQLFNLMDQSLGIVWCFVIAHLLILVIVVDDVHHAEVAWVGV